MSGADDLGWMSIFELAPLLRAREVSPVEVVEAMLERISRLDDFLKVFITLTPEEALTDAARAEAEIMAGRYRGPLHGVPVAFKDNYQTAGVRTTAHSRLYLDFVPGTDAAVVEQWKRAGAISLGKTNLYELASGREQELFGIPRNPWAPDRVTGGSSSGNAAGLAAGLFYGAAGTDGGGSIRAPAALCGVVGLRPTYGLVSRRGLTDTPISSSNTCGPMARSVRDIALLLQPLATYDPLDPYALPSPEPPPDYLAALEGEIKGVRIGIPAQYFFEPEYAEPDVLATVRHAVEGLAALGAELVVVTLPHVHLTDILYEVIVHAESGAHYSETLTERPEDFGFSTRVSLTAGQHITAREYIHAQQLRSLVQQDFRQAFGMVDLIAAPTTYQTARPPHVDARLRRPHPRRPFSLTGGPSISIPCGFGWDGLPIGLQLAGRPWEEATLLRVARAWEESHPLPLRPPLDGTTDAPPLAIPPPRRSVEEAVRARLEAMRRDMAIVRELDLDTLPPALRYHPERWTLARQEAEK